MQGPAVCHRGRICLCPFDLLPHTLPSWLISVEAPDKVEGGWDSPPDIEVPCCYLIVRSRWSRRTACLPLARVLSS